MQEDKIKRGRTCNYTIEETLKLMDFIETSKHIIENKKTDAKSCQTKMAEWESIAMKFNVFTSSPRTAEQLRTKFENMKRQARKYFAIHQEDLMRTGHSSSRENSILDRALKVMNLLPADYDTNALDFSAASQMHNDGAENFFIKVEEEEIASKHGDMEMDPELKESPFADTPVLSPCHPQDAVLERADNNRSVDGKLMSAAIVLSTEKRIVDEEAHNETVISAMDQSKDKRIRKRRKHGISSFNSESRDNVKLQARILQSTFENTQRREEEIFSKKLKLLDLQIEQVNLAVEKERLIISKLRSKDNILEILRNVS